MENLSVEDDGRARDRDMDRDRCRVRSRGIGHVDEDRASDRLTRFERGEVEVRYVEALSVRSVVNGRISDRRVGLDSPRIGSDRDLVVRRGE